MLKFIRRISRVGVFNDADGTSFPLESLSLIYAGNGQGKSTLCAALSAAGTGGTDEIIERQAIGTDQPALIKLENGSGDSLVYAKERWIGAPLNTSVFDTAFVERNVHTGGEVRPSHRAELLAFAIGETAVAHEAVLETAQSNLATAKEELRQNESNILSAAHVVDSSCTVDSFKKVAVPPEVAEKISEAEVALNDGKNAARIYGQSLPREIDGLRLLTDEFFDVLESGLPGVHRQARERVKRHVKHLEERGSRVDPESWLAQGTKLPNDSKCPFCGQGLEGTDLVDMYAAYFDEAYNNLWSRLEALEATLGVSARTRRLKELNAAWRQADESLRAWRTHLDLPPLPSLESLDERLAALGDWLDASLAAKKERMDLASDLSNERQFGRDLEDAVLATTVRTNETIRDAQQKIGAYKESLVKRSVSELEADLAAVRLQELRGTREIQELFAARARLQGDIKTYEANARAARATIKETMNSTLLEFEQSINKHLLELHAGFSVEKVTATFAGGGSRGSYALKLQGQSIDVSSGVPPFRLALSEGDKRTLAFAFFCAVILSETNLQGRVVIVDDPVTSLDKHRRTHAIDHLNEISRRGAQVIVFSHDATFLRDTRDRVASSGSDQSGQPRLSTEIQLKRNHRGHSSFANIDLDLECASRYFVNHQTITHFLEGQEFNGRPVTHADAGKAIRPLIESYLHRRFPGGLIPKDKRMLGQAIGHIRDSPSHHVVAYAKPLLEELDHLNNFGLRYHHDSKSDAGEHEPDEHEVLAFASRALRVVHGAP
ncbi:AAA family ATPase [Nesterenkonia sp. Act20]|uniref:AAA family ATPase n=1 Tax=Nesterenkonia sp. Act20 TaxID=1483432 RepID=UPI001C49597E|nr:AAA family ATPase [Nesterenkonia sp. Act20]